MRVDRKVKKALYTGAFLLLALLITRYVDEPTTPQVVNRPLANSRCEAPPQADDIVETKLVVDGDTLHTTDGRKIRLIGINTPELARDGNAEQAFARDARDKLLEIAGPGTRLKLYRDREHQDRYRRKLAHLYLQDGTSVQETLLRAGLATTLVVPPNDGFSSCYAAAEAAARHERAGIWSHPRYQVREASALPHDADGYFIVRGRITRIGNSRSAVWLNLDREALALRIGRDDLGYFTDYDPATLHDKTVTARGWIHMVKGELRMQVRHPRALNVED